MYSTSLLSSVFYKFYFIYDGLTLILILITAWYYYYYYCSANSLFINLCTDFVRNSISVNINYHITIIINIKPS